jgi:hypothetical protein
VIGRVVCIFSLQRKIRTSLPPFIFFSAEVYFCCTCLLISATIYDGNIFIASEGKGLIFPNSGNTEYPWIRYALEGNFIYGQQLTSLPTNVVKQETGSVRLAGADKTIIFRTYGENCYKLEINEDGIINAVSTICP